jgi:hypothetical protein
MQKYLSPDQISFYDETLKKQLEGSYRYDGKWIYVASQKYGARTAPRGPIIDIFTLNLFAQKVLRDLAHDSERDAEKDTPQPLKQAAWAHLPQARRGFVCLNNNSMNFLFGSGNGGFLLSPEIGAAAIRRSCAGVVKNTLCMTITSLLAFWSWLCLWRRWELCRDGNNQGGGKRRAGVGFQV